jgi:3',5'-cyclic AMP phosphodiesterase CpdA
VKLYAISDLHIACDVNRRAVEDISPMPDDWLILAGDVCERESDLRWALETLRPRFARILWTPGNHELWTLQDNGHALRGEAKYRSLLAICRELGVVTPEDAYPLWEGGGGPAYIASVFLLYDYSFRPDGLPLEEAVSWAQTGGVVCADEHLLHPDPHRSREAWCADRVSLTERRLAAAQATRIPIVLVNHFPLRRDLASTPLIPRFSLWCGTRRTEEWHTQYNIRVVVSGHVHIRGTQWRNGVRFEEVSLGYPRQWQQSRGIASYLRQILPAPHSFESGQARIA